MTVWTVWERVDDWPESGGGDYLKRIFQNKEDAEKYCKQMNGEAEEIEVGDTSFCVEEWPLH